MNPIAMNESGLDDAQMRFYDDNGFLPLSNVAQPEEIAEIRQYLEGILARKAGAEEGALFDFVGGEALTKSALTQMLHPSNHEPRLRRTAYRQRLKLLARQVLGPGARFSGDHIFFKPAHEGPVTPWHQDEAFRDPDMEYREVSFWLPLQAVDEENGCLKFIPASHRLQVLPHSRQTGQHGLECADGFDPDTAIACPLPVGGCTLHHGRTLHGAGANDSTVDRYAYVVHFDLPRQAARHKRIFDWQQRKSPRELQEQQWRSGPGRLVHAYRRLRQLNFLDPYRLMSAWRRYLERNASRRVM